MKPPSALWSLLFFAAALHCLVDLTAGSLNPLWPRLDAHYGLYPWQSAGLFFLWQMTTSISQFFFGLYGDRFNARWLLWAGPVAAIVCLGSIGLTKSPFVLAQLLIISGLGIAAFHPEAAALAGSCAPESRSRAMSIFTMGGFIGQAIGPVYSGSVVDALGMRGLAWGILGGLLAAALLAPLGLRVLSVPARETAPPVKLTEIFRGRVWSLFLILAIGSLRIIAAAGVPVLLGYLLTARGGTASETGLVQSAFMLGIGLGGLACATLLQRRHERAILWLCPLLATPILLATPWTGGLLLAVLASLSGLLLGISLPVLISYGQELMPNSQRIASSITMGVSWGIGGGAVSVILAVCQYEGHFEPAFAVFAVATALSSVLCIWLPKTEQAAEPEKAAGGKLPSGFSESAPVPIRPA